MLDGVAVDVDEGEVVVLLGRDRAVARGRVGVEMAMRRERRGRGICRSIAKVVVVVSVVEIRQ